MSDNVREIPTKPDVVLAALEHMRRNMDAHIEYAKLVSRLRRVSFDSAIEQGFTKEEALVLCQKPLGF